ncbi:hypothetical protein BC938DRAFT_477507, partial [Jimgerdemannia flammicorona]
MTSNQETRDPLQWALMISTLKQNIVKLPKECHDAVAQLDELQKQFCGQPHIEAYEANPRPFEERTDAEIAEELIEKAARLLALKGRSASLSVMNDRLKQLELALDSNGVKKAALLSGDKLTEPADSGPIPPTHVSPADLQASFCIVEKPVVHDEMPLHSESRVIPLQVTEVASTDESHVISLQGTEVASTDESHVISLQDTKVASADDNSKSRQDTKV